MIIIFHYVNKDENNINNTYNTNNTTEEIERAAEEETQRYLSTSMVWLLCCKNFFYDFFANFQEWKQ